MAKYKITNIDEAKGLVTFQVLNNTGTVLHEDTRCDLAIEDAQSVKDELNRCAASIVADAKAARKAEKALKDIVNVAQTVKE